MSLLRPGALATWAMRDLMRRPGDALLTGLAILALVAMVSTSLLLVEGATRTAEALIERGPDLVIRRLDAGGWAPMPVAEGMVAAGPVRGVQRLRPRVWGVLAGPYGAITLVGCDDAMREDLGALHVDPPAVHQAIVGDRMSDLLGESLTLASEDRWDTFDVTAVFTAEADAATFDVVLVDEEAARWLLGIPEGFATDLALDVFHEEEADALRAALGHALPFPARVMTRADARGVHGDVLGRRGGLAGIAAVPAALALLLLVAATAREGVGRRREVGLLKTLGWTTADVVRLHMLRALLVGLPATALGLAAAYGLVFWPGVSWPGELLLGWQGRGPALHLDPAGATLVMLEVAGLVLIPWLVATVWPVARGAAEDPQAMLEAR
jgi:hypothetical protein